MHIVRQPDVDVVVEVMGGIHPAYEIIMEAIKHGNRWLPQTRPLLAEHGNELFKAAEDNAAVKSPMKRRLLVVFQLSR